MVGTSMAFSLNRWADVPAASRSATTHCKVVGKIGLRSLKLYALGLLLDGGNWFGDDYSFGYSLDTLRFCGILQRIAICFLVVALVYVLIPPLQPMCDGHASTVVTSAAAADEGRGSGEQQPSMIDTPPPRRIISMLMKRSSLAPHLALFGERCGVYLVGCASLALYEALVFLVPVADWSLHVGEAVEAGWNASQLVVHCGNVRGDVSNPGCWAGGAIDRAVFGQHRLGGTQTYHSAWCSTCPPSKCPKELTDPTRPVWCDRPGYDAESLLSTIPCVLSTVLGLHLGVVLTTKRLQSPQSRIVHGVLYSTALTAVGLLLNLKGDRFNKQRWTASYTLYSAGTCGLALTVSYAVVDNLLPWLRTQPRRRRAPYSPLVAAVEEEAEAAGEEGGDAGERSREGAAVTCARRTLLALAWPLLEPTVAMGQNAILFFVLNQSEFLLTESFFWEGGGRRSVGACAKGHRCTLLPWLKDALLTSVPDDTGGAEKHSPRGVLFVALKLLLLYFPAALLFSWQKVFLKI